MVSKLGLMAFSLVLLSSCSKSSNNKNSEEYLDKLAGIICQYREKHEKLPEFFDLALDESGETLHNRGDYHGEPYKYIVLGNGHFLIHGSDTEVFYAKCEKTDEVTFYSDIQTKLKKK